MVKTLTYSVCLGGREGSQESDPGLTDFKVCSVHSGTLSGSSALFTRSSEQPQAAPPKPETLNQQACPTDRCDGAGRSLALETDTCWDSHQTLGPGVGHLTSRPSSSLPGKGLRERRTSGSMHNGRDDFRWPIASCFFFRGCRYVDCVLDHIDRTCTRKSQCHGHFCLGNVSVRDKQSADLRDSTK